MKLSNLILVFTILILQILCDEPLNATQTNKCMPQGIHINYGDKYGTNTNKNIQMQVIYFTQNKCSHNYLQFYQDPNQKTEIQVGKTIKNDLTNVFFHYLYIKGITEYDKLVYYSIYYPENDEIDINDEINNQDDNKISNLRQNRILDNDQIIKYLNTEEFYFNYSRDNQNGNDNNKLIFLADFGLNNMNISKGTIDSLQAIVDDKNNLIQYKGVVHVGDISYDMTDNQGLKGLDYLIKTQSIFSKIPYITVAGNHEYDHEYFLTSYPNVMQTKKLYYSWNVGNFHLIGLYTGNYNKFKDSSDKENQDFMNEQRQFLQKNLENANKQANREEYPWIIVYFHEPLVCSYPSDKDDCNKKSQNQMKNDIQFLLEKNKVDLVVQGHVHQYERSFPINSKIWSNDKSQNKGFKSIADYYDRNYDCEHTSTKKCQIFHNPEGIIYTLEGAAGTEHYLVEQDYQLEEYTIYKGLLEYEDQPGVVQTGYGIVTSNSGFELSYEHFNTVNKKVVDSFKIQKTDNFSKIPDSIEDQTGDLIPDYTKDDKNDNDEYKVVFISGGVTIAIIVIGLIIYRIIRRKMVQQNGQNLIEEMDSNRDKTSNIKFELPSLDINTDRQQEKNNNDIDIELELNKQQTL